MLRGSYGYIFSFSFKLACTFCNFGFLSCHCPFGFFKISLKLCITCLGKSQLAQHSSKNRLFTVNVWMCFGTWGKLTLSKRSRWFLSKNVSGRISVHSHNIYIYYLYHPIQHIFRHEEWTQVRLLPFKLKKKSHNKHKCFNYYNICIFSWNNDARTWCMFIILSNTAHI